jgi:hypothetical protein
MFSVLKSRKSRRNVFETLFQAIPQSQEFLVLDTAEIDIPRECAHRPKGNQHKLDQSKDHIGQAADKKGDNTANQRNDEDKITELVVSVATVQKSAEQEITSKSCLIIFLFEMPSRGAHIVQAFFGFEAELKFGF